MMRTYPALSYVSTTKRQVQVERFRLSSMVAASAPRHLNRTRKLEAGLKEKETIDGRGLNPGHPI
jgi:hypothetical protein